MNRKRKKRIRNPLMSLMLVSAGIQTVLPVQAIWYEEIQDEDPVYTAGKLEYVIQEKEGRKAAVVIGWKKRSQEESQALSLARTIRELVLPDRIFLDGIEYPIVAIAPKALAQSALERVTVPENLEEIGPQAFGGCEHLQEVRLPGNTSWDPEAFADCPWVKVFDAKDQLLFDGTPDEKTSDLEVLQAKSQEEVDDQKEDIDELPDTSQEEIQVLETGTDVENLPEEKEDSTCVEKEKKAAEEKQEEKAVCLEVQETNTAEILEMGKANAELSGWWVKLNGHWRYKLVNGTWVKNTWRQIDGVTYYFLPNGDMAEGWQQIAGSWYFFNASGALVRSCWVDTWYVNEEGKWIPDGWVLQRQNLVYQKGDGTLLTNAWRKKDGIWYYLQRDGLPAKNGWLKVNGLYYYFEKDGAMAASTWKGEYYVCADGHRIKPGWVTSQGRLWYQNLDGSYPKDGWAWIENEKYHFDAQGWLSTGFFEQDGLCFYALANGKLLKNKFFQLSGNVYYTDEQGQLLQVPFRLEGVRFVPDAQGSIEQVVINDISYAASQDFQWSSLFTQGYQLDPSKAVEKIIDRFEKPALTGTLCKTVDGKSYQLLRFPMKVMKVTQGTNGQFTHQGVEALDIAGKDTGIDALYAPCDMHLIARDTYAHGNATFWESDQPVLFADGTIDYATFMFIHDSYIGDLQSSYKQWEEFGDEGIAGYATGNHCHFEVAKGKFTRCYYLNYYGVYGLPNSISPDAACVIDDVLLYNNGQTLSTGRNMVWKRSDKVTKTTGILERPANAITEQGKFWVKATVKVRKEPGKAGKDTKTTLSKGDAVVYDCYVQKDGYIWLGYVDKQGERLWIAAGEYKNNRYTEMYGVFE